MDTLRSLSSAEEIALAKASSQELSAILPMDGQASTFNITSDDGVAHAVTIPSGALKLMVEILTQLGQGNVVNITPIHAEMTTQEGADILNISRSTFIKLLNTGEIPHSRTGNRRKVAFTDIMKYKDALETKRLKSLNDLSSLDQELGNMGY
ncbi:MAG: helix-turn-helix domain-containing protein [Alteromonadaceae bacterium]|nr:helix-turn-helix domain-containing protein [Alteromonadaceae bacterium]